MRRLLFVLPALLATAAAAGDWKSVKLDDGSSIEVPASAAKAFQPGAERKKAGYLMEFTVDDLQCLLTRADYNDPGRRKRLVAHFASAGRDDLCEFAAGDDAVDLTPEKSESRSLSVSGLPAMQCVVSFGTGGKGAVIAKLDVAAPEFFYQLDCEVRGAAREAALAAWKARWAAPVARVRKSLRLPAAKKKAP